MPARNRQAISRGVPETLWTDSSLQGPRRHAEIAWAARPLPGLSPRRISVDIVEAHDGAPQLAVNVGMTVMSRFLGASATPQLVGRTSGDAIPRLSAAWLHAPISFPRRGVDLMVAIDGTLYQSGTHGDSMRARSVGTLMVECAKRSKGSS